jgi:hypothetical protein
MARLPARLLDELQPRQGLDHPPEEDVELDLREGRADAVVDAGAE